MYEIAHLGIVVKDCEQSANFYCEVLGCTLIERIENANLKIINLQHGPLIIELLEYLKPSVTARAAGIYDHLAFAVHNIEKTISSLQEKGIVFESDKPMLAGSGKKIIFFKGPNGERIELVEKV